MEANQSNGLIFITSSMAHDIPQSNDIYSLGRVILMCYDIQSLITVITKASI